MKDTIFSYLLYKKSVAFLYGNMSIEESLIFMKEHHYTSVPVIKPSGEYIGSVSEGDFLWSLLETTNKAEFFNRSISSIIRKDYLKACTIDTSTDILIQLLLDQNYVPIVDDRNIFIGIVTRKSVLSSLI